MIAEKMFWMYICIPLSSGNQDRNRFTFVHSGEQNRAVVLTSFVTRMCKIRILEFGIRTIKTFLF